MNRYFCIFYKYYLSINYAGAGFISWIIFLIPNQAIAQSVDNYSVSHITGISYNSIISSGSSFANWRNTGSFSEDDNRSESTDIGFDFWYNGQRYTQFSVSTNGFMDFSNSTDDGGPQPDDYGYSNGAFSAFNISGGTWLALAPFYDDMTTRAGTDPLGNSIKYQLEGMAPNRILTVEWDAMAVYQNNTPDLNFQVKLYETTGVIEYNYGVMDAGTNTFSYTVGINAASVSNPPITSELKTQQTANIATFSNTPQNDLNTMPTANSQLRFTPPVPTPPLGILTISGLTNTGMTLNWPNWATNEIGYVIHVSSDNVNFLFNSQTTADAISSTITGLSPSTIYYWQVSAVTEGRLGASLSANGMTLSPGTIISARSGRWDRTNTWDCACIPTAADNVLIQDDHTVRLRSNDIMVCNDLTIGQGTNGVAQFNSNTARTLTINGNLTLNNGAVFSQQTNSNTTHTVNFQGNIINNGIFNLAVDGNSRCNSVFIKTDGNQTVSGSGTTEFHRITIDKGSKGNLLEITTSDFTCDSDALSFSSGGTFKFSSPGSNSFQLFNSLRDVPANSRIWMNSAGSTMNFGAGINLFGDLQLDDGTVVIGDASNENLVSSGGELEINGGTMLIAGNYSPNTLQSISNYVQTGGTLTLPVVSSGSTSLSPFNMSVSGSTLTITGGSIILQREGGTGAQNLGYNTSGVGSYTVTGGTLQVGNASTPAGQTMLINAGAPIGNLLVNSANATGQLSVNDLIVLNDVTLTTGELSDNERDITFGGNWLASGGFFTGSILSTTTANGGNQSFETGGSAFNDLVLAGTGTKSFQDDLNINGDLTFSTTFLPANSGFNLAIGGHWVNNGSFTRNNETTTFNGSTGGQNISGSSATDFTNITVNKSGGMVSVNGTANLHRTLDIQSSTTFDADGTGAGVFTILSSGDNPVVDGRVATLTGGAAITGNATVRRYMAPETSGVTRVYRYISSPVSGQFVSDWQDDFPITGTFSNPNTEFPSGSGITSICDVNLFPTNPSLYQYSELGTGTGSNDLGWTAYPAGGLSSASPLEVGRGYAAFIRECTNPTIVDVRGPINQGAISLTSLVSLTSNGDLEDGFNLVGNPYPSAIDWNIDAGWTRTGISSVLYIRDNGGTGGFITYDYTDNTPLVIATGQAFWVRVTTGSPSFSINEQAKTGNSAVFYRIGSNNKLSISLSKDNITDKAIVKINPQSIGKLDDFDGPKLDNTLFDVSTLSEDGISMAVNSLDKVDCNFVLPIKIKDATNGMYKLGFEREGIFSEYDIEIFDRFMNILTDLTQTSLYEFNVTNNAESKATDRFELRFTSTQEIDLDLPIVSNKSICEDEDAFVTIQNSQPGVDYYIEKNGLILTDSIVGTGQNLELTIPAGNLEQGINQLTVIASKICKGKYEMNVKPNISIANLSPAQILSVPKCGRGSVTLKAIGVSEGSTVNWYDDIDSDSPIFTGDVFTSPDLKKSKTFYASLVSDQGCEGIRIATKAVIIAYDEAMITVKSDTLLSNYESGNQWFKDGQIIPAANGNLFIVEDSGLYKLQVQINEGACSTSAETFVTVAGKVQEAVNRVVVSPNPVRKEIVIKFPKSFEDHAVLIDSYGRVISTIDLKDNEGWWEARYNIEHLPSGVYSVGGGVQGSNPIYIKVIKQ